MPFRSTKGASKQRRDQINEHVMQLRSLLPLQESTRQRLSQLQVMSLLCVHLRKNNMFHLAEKKPCASSWSPKDLQEDFMKLLPGFLLVVNKDGKLVYVSDNVTDYLGHSMVDMMTQGDCVYDIVDERDHSDVQTHLEQSWSQRATSEAQSTFFCRMNVARTLRRPCSYREQKVMTVRGQVTSLSDDPADDAFVAVCSPLLTPEVKDSVYRSGTDLVWMEHSLDLKIQACSPLVLEHLGCSQQELQGKSLYELLHPEDLAEAKRLHMRVLKLAPDQGVMLASRLQTAAGAWLPVSSVMCLQQEADGARKLISVHSPVRAEAFSAYAAQSRAYNEQLRQMPYSLQRASPPSPAQPEMELDGLLAQLVSDDVIACSDELRAQPGSVPAACSPQFQSSGMALKRKLAEPRVNYPRKSVRLTLGMSGADWETQTGMLNLQPDMLDLQPGMLDLLTDELSPPWPTQTSSAHAPFTPEPQTTDIDIGEILNLPSFKQELVAESPSSSIESSPHSSPAWLPPSPPQGSPLAGSPPYASPPHCSPSQLTYQQPIVPMLSGRLLPEMGANEVIDFFSVAPETKAESQLIPTTVLFLQEEGLSAPMPLKLEPQVDPRALQVSNSDVLQKTEPGAYGSLLDEVLSESDSESLLEADELEQGCQSLLRFFGAELDSAIHAF